MSNVKSLLKQLKQKKDVLREREVRLADDLDQVQQQRTRLSDAIRVIQEELGENEAGLYAGLSILDAAKRFLQQAGQFTDTGTIRDALLKEGFVTTSRDFYNTLYATLDRNARNPDRSGVVKEGNKWGLAEWLDEASDEDSPGAEDVDF